MVFEDLHKILENKKALQRYLNVGIFGPSGAGKTYFTREFSQYLVENKEVCAIPWYCDIYFASSREQRSEVMNEARKLSSLGRKDPNWPDRAYPFKDDLMLEHLKKIKERQSFFSNGLCDPVTKSLNYKVGINFSDNGDIEVLPGRKTIHGGNSAWFIIDSSFLGVKKLREQIDLLVFLDVGYDVRLNRAYKRGRALEKPIEVDEELFRDVDIWQARKYKINRDNVDVVIDNNDFRKRKIIGL